MSVFITWITLIGLAFTAPAAVRRSSAPAVAQQPPPAQPPRATTPPTNAPARDTRASVASGSATIRGRITTADTGEPVRRARVSIDTAVPRAVATDLDGRFEFAHLPAGRHLLTAAKTGFVSLVYGQRRPFERGRPVELAEGQTIEKLDWTLPRSGVLAGRVVNELGESVSGILVTAIRRSFSAGNPTWRMVGRANETDDLGQFRVSGLPPGTYYVGALRPTIAEMGMAPDDGVVSRPTFHPGSVVSQEARPVTLRLGREVHGVDIALVPGRAAALSGTVLFADGRRASDCTISVRGASGTLLSLLAEPVFVRSVEGRFSLKNLSPGDYLLRAAKANPDSGATESVDLSVSVAEDGIDNLIVQLSPPARIVGRVAIDGEQQPPFRPTSLRIGAAEASAGVGADWKFQIEGVRPGVNRLSVAGLPAGWAMKTVTAGGRELDDDGLNAMGGATAQVEVVVTSRLTSVTGIVTDDRGQRPADYTVVVFSEEPNRWRRTKVSRPDQQGTYRVEGLLPGAYRVIAVEYLDEGDEQSAEFLAWVKARASRVELVAGGAAKLDLRLVKFEEGL